MDGVNVEFPGWEDVSVLPIEMDRISVKGKGRETGRKQHKRGKMLTVS